MMAKQITTAILLVLFSGTMLSQDFKKDWANFSTNPNWEILFEKDSLHYLDKYTKGRLVFKNPNGTTPRIEYFVYILTDVDSTFESKIEEMMLGQSCNGFLEDRVSFMSFSYKGYYYLLKPCISCDETTNKEDCITLANQILTLILEK